MPDHPSTPPATAHRDIAGNTQHRPLPAPQPPFDPAELAVRRKTRLLKVIRIVFVVVLLLAGMIRFFALGSTTDPSDLFLARYWYLPMGVAAVMALLAIAVDLLTPSKKISTLVSVSVGLLIGVATTIVVSLLIDFLAQIYAVDKSFTFMCKVFLSICLCYLGVTLVLQTQDDVRLVIPYVEFAKQLRGPRPLVIDSSALIDARFADALQTGFFQAPIIIPRFVLAELQHLADSQDKLKRAKGRRALDIVARLQRQAALDVTIDPTSSSGVGVDQALVDLAVRIRGMIVTTDSGLARIATIQGGTVLNVNDLASALRPALAAGEFVTVKLVKPGEQPGQAVGYLADGTMIVAEDGGNHLNREVALMVVSTLQTSAGRLVFARLAESVSGGSVVENGPAVDEQPGDESGIGEATAGGGGEGEGSEDDPAHPSSRPQGPFGPRGPHGGPGRAKNRFRNPRR
ncbi:MAG: PIN/TRAM domain-containing protein [Phycisphaerales bacterium]|nr:PIN/TRAM domain-containing protein [Phycisphaerales bacterium]